MDQITVQTMDGEYSAPSDVVDMMVARYLPTSPVQLRVIAEEQAGHSLKAVRDVSTLLVILADFANASLTA